VGSACVSATGHREAVRWLHANRAMRRRRRQTRCGAEDGRSSATAQMRPDPSVRQNTGEVQVKRSESARSRALIQARSNDLDGRARDRPIRPIIGRPSTVCGPRQAARRRTGSIRRATSMAPGRRVLLPDAACAEKSRKCRAPQPWTRLARKQSAARSGRPGILAWKGRVGQSQVVQVPGGEKRKPIWRAVGRSFSSSETPPPPPVLGQNRSARAQMVASRGHQRPPSRRSRFSSSPRSIASSRETSMSD
jgi:hypothetical protein